MPRFPEGQNLCTVGESADSMMLCLQFGDQLGVGFRAKATVAGVFLAFRLRIRGSRFRGLLIHDQVGECRGRGEFELCVCDPGPGGSWDLVSKVISILVGIIHVTTIL